MPYMTAYIENNILEDKKNIFKKIFFRLLSMDIFHLMNLFYFSKNEKDILYANP